MTKLKPRFRRPAAEWDGESIAPGESRDVLLAVGESYSSMTVQIPIHVRRGLEDGPAVLVTAALHGDEINGTGAIRRLIRDPNLRLLKGTLILVPVLNILGFERHSRYLPDRRDLNRAFRGSAKGSLASRLARQIFDELVSRADYCIDLHTAAVRRTNFPNVRGDLANPEVRRLAQAFGTEIILDGRGPKGALRREACRAGCPTIVMEGGEVWKVEPDIVESAMTGVRNTLVELGMIEAVPQRPSFQLVITKKKWMRAEFGGFLRFHIRPGEIVERRQILATNSTLLGEELGVLRAPFDGIVIGMATLPAISPGEAVCNLGRLPVGTSVSELRALRAAAAGPQIAD